MHKMTTVAKAKKKKRGKGKIIYSDMMGDNLFSCSSHTRHKNDKEKPSF